MRSIAKAGKMTDKPSRTVGIDLGDRFCSYCILNQDGDACRVRAPNHLFGYQAHYPPPGNSRWSMTPLSRTLHKTMAIFLEC